MRARGPVIQQLDITTEESLDSGDLRVNASPFHSSASIQPSLMQMSVNSLSLSSSGSSSGQQLANAAGLSIAELDQIDIGNPQAFLSDLSDGDTDILSGHNNNINNQSSSTSSSSSSSSSVLKKKRARENDDLDVGRDSVTEVGSAVSSSHSAAAHPSSQVTSFPLLTAYEQEQVSILKLIQQKQQEKQHLEQQLREKLAQLQQQHSHSSGSQDQFVHSAASSASFSPTSSSSSSSLSRQANLDPGTVRSRKFVCARTGRFVKLDPILENAVIHKDLFIDRAFMASGLKKYKPKLTKLCFSEKGMAIYEGDRLKNVIDKLAAAVAADRVVTYSYFKAHLDNGQANSSSLRGQADSPDNNPNELSFLLSHDSSSSSSSSSSFSQAARTNAYDDSSQLNQASSGLDLLLSASSSSEILDGVSVESQYSEGQPSPGSVRHDSSSHSRSKVQECLSDVSKGIQRNRRWVFAHPQNNRTIDVPVTAELDRYIKCAMVYIKGNANKSIYVQPGEMLSTVILAEIASFKARVRSGEIICYSTYYSRKKSANEKNKNTNNQSSSSSSLTQQQTISTALGQTDEEDQENLFSNVDLSLSRSASSNSINHHARLFSQNNLFRSQVSSGLPSHNGASQVVSLFNDEHDEGQNNLLH